jgi:hypothetical protein
VSAIGRMLNRDSAKWIPRLEREIPQRSGRLPWRGVGRKGRSDLNVGAASVGGLVRLFGLVGLLRPFNEVNKFVC